MSRRLILFMAMALVSSNALAQSIQDAEVETFTVFAPNEKGIYNYNHGVVLFPFKGMLYAQWQSSSRDEDSQDTRVLYSRSRDGEHWSEPLPLSDNTIKRPKNRKWLSPQTMTTSGGWWSDGATLIAYINVWPDQDMPCKEGYTICLISDDGEKWSFAGRLTDTEGHPIDGIIEQDLHSLPSGRIITAFHIPPGLTCVPFYTDDPAGITGWKKGEITLPEGEKCTSRGIEPGWYYRRDGTVVMVFRDQKSTFQQLESISHDQGETWSTPEVNGFPDSRAKQSAGNFPDGTAYIVNCPSGNKNRYPLVLSTSSDGVEFDRSIVLRSGEDGDLPPLRFEGKYKRGGYSYPKSVVWDNYLYVGYATNKEDVQITRIKIK